MIGSCGHHIGDNRDRYKMDDGRVVCVDCGRAELRARVNPVLQSSPKFTDWFAKGRGLNSLQQQMRA